jgi:hypothetical protein
MLQDEEICMDLSENLIPSWNPLDTRSNSSPSQGKGASPLPGGHDKTSPEEAVSKDDACSGNVTQPPNLPAH